MPSRPEWFSELSARRYPGDDTFLLSNHRGRVSWDHRDVFAHFESKRALAAALAPDHIIEIGVRAGYSAFAMLCGAPCASYLGIDSQDPAYGDSARMALHARKLLEPFPADFMRADTQLMRSIEHGFPSQHVSILVHVDGDHTYEGAKHDIELALGCGARWVLVDDTEYLPDVARAAREFVAGRLSMKVLEPLRGAFLFWGEP